MPRAQMQLIPSSLEEVIPSDHPVRMVDELLDRLDWSGWESEYHGSFGQPPIHPSVMSKVLLFALIRRIRSSRQIEYALKHSIDFMWLSSGRHIDHTTLSEFRRQHTSQLRSIFRQLVTLAIDLKIANLSELCIDGTRVLANANKYKSWTAAKLEKLLSELDAQLMEALSSLEATDRTNEDLFGEDYSVDQLPPELAKLQTRREKLTEHLETLREMEKARAKYGKDPEKNPAQIPRTDPDSRILPNKEGGYAPNFTPMVTVESQGGFIVHTDVLIGNVEHDQFTTIVSSVVEDYEAVIARVLADAAYTNGGNLTAAEELEIELIGPLAELKCENNPAHRDDLTQPVAESEVCNLPINPQTKRFDKSSFVYVEEEDCYYCPAGRSLPHRCTEKAHPESRTPEKRVYTSPDCKGCSLVDLCRKNPKSKKGREVSHDNHEAARRRHRERMKTSEAQTAYKRRTHAAEVPFAAMKAAFDMRRFLLRGIEGVGQEWLWASTAFNMKKLMGMWGTVCAAPNTQPEQ